MFLVNDPGSSNGKMSVLTDKLLFGLILFFMGLMKC